MIVTMTQGDLKPDVVITIADSRSDADFTNLTADNVRLVGEIQGVDVVDGKVDSITPSDDGKSAIIRRAWQEGETDTVGRCWLRVVVDWPDGAPQTFPKGTPLFVDIRRGSSDG